MTAAFRLTGLVMKEMRQLAPIAWLWAGLEAFEWLLNFFSKRIDEESFANWCQSMCTVGVDQGLATIYLIFGLIVGYSLFPREHDDATIDYLRALPVSRSDIFFSKLLAAFLLMVGLTLFSSTLAHLGLTSNPESLRGGQYPQLSLAFTIRDIIAFFVIISYGIFLSWFRIVGLLIFIGYIFLLIWFETQLQLTGPWNPTEMFRVKYVGQQLKLPWQALGVQSIAAVILLVISHRLWSRTESQGKSKKSGILSSRWLSIVATVFGLGFAAIVALALQSNQAGSSATDGTRKLATEHYRFIFHERVESRANAIAEIADGDYQAIAAHLNSTTKPFIRANLTSTSNHFAGQAGWKSLRMDLSGVHPKKYFRHVLAHETVHVFQSTESRRQLRDNFNSVRFFIEGSAEYVAFSVLPNEKRRQNNWRQAAVAVNRLKIDFENLADNAGFMQKFDPDMYYAVGDIWTASLVSACGDDSVGKVFRAIGRDDRPTGLSGMAFWQNTIQAIGCELADVNAHWASTIRQINDEAGETAFPRFENVTVGRTDRSAVAIQASVVKPHPATWPGGFHVRIERQSNLATEPDAVFSGRLINEPGGQRVRFTIPLSAVAGGRFRYQLGYYPPDTHAGIYERWRSGVVPSQ